MIEPYPTQDPDANLDYWFDIRPAVAAQASPLASYTLTVTGDDDALELTGEVLSDDVVYFWLGYPTDGASYTVTCHFELVNGFADDMSRTLLGVHH